MDIKYIDEVPIVGNIEQYSDNVSNEIKLKTYLNLGFNSVNSFDRLLDIQSLHSQELNTFTQPSLYSLFISLESYLCLLVSVICTMSNDRSELSKHYSLSKSVIQPYLPSDEYLSNLLFSGQKVWGFTYGTLGYYLYLSEDYSHYKSPSELVYDSSLSLINHMSVISSGYNYNKFSSFLLSNMLNDSENVDNQIYMSYLTALTLLDDWNDVYSNLLLFNSLIPSIYNYYIGNDFSDYSEEARNILLEISKIIFSTGLFQFPSIYEIVHMNYSYLTYELYESLIYLRRKTVYEPTAQDGPLINSFIKDVNFTTSPTAFRSMMNNLLRMLTPPGGYNMLMVLVGSTLLNRGYSLLYEVIENQSSMDMSDISEDKLSRIYKLIYLSSCCLRRCSLDHLYKIGSNLLLLSNNEPDNKDFRGRDFING